MEEGEGNFTKTCEISKKKLILRGSKIPRQVLAQKSSEIMFGQRHIILLFLIIISFFFY